MSPHSGRKKIAQGEASEANGTLGRAVITVSSPLKRAHKDELGVIPGFRFAPPGATICHPLRGFIE